MLGNAAAVRLPGIWQMASTPPAMSGERRLATSHADSRYRLQLQPGRADFAFMMASCDTMLTSAGT